jgi:hypothetical protein
MARLSLKMSLTDVHIRIHRMRGSFLAHTLATVPGFNWLLVDAEHGQITDSDIYDVCVLAPSKTAGYTVWWRNLLMMSLTLPNILALQHDYQPRHQPDRQDPVG